MKKRIMHIMLILLLLQIVWAGEVFNDEVKDNVPFTINGIKHIARYYPSAEKVSILAGEDRVLVDKGDCESLNDLTYCLDSVEEGINEETGDPASIMQLRVMQSGPTIEIDRSVSETKPLINEAVEVSATISNTGNERASNINYEDRFPSSVKVSSAYYSFATNSVAWTGSLNPGESRDVKYTLKFQDFIEYDSTAQAKYVFNNKINTVKSSEVRFEVQKPYEISDSLTPGSADTNEDIEYTISINNTDEDNEISVSKLEVSIPSGAVVSHRDAGIDLEDGKIKYVGPIPGGSSKTISFSFKSPKICEGDVVADIEIRSGGRTFKETLSRKVRIGVSDIVPEIKFDPEPVKSGAELEIEAKITNNGEETISDIILDMSGDLVEPRGWRNLELEPGRHFYAFNKIINAPSDDYVKNYSIKLSGSYETSTGKTMKFEGVEDVEVLPQEKVVELSPEIAVNGRDVNVTLKVKNVAPYKLTYVSLIDTFPKGFKTIAGSRDIDIDELAVGQEITAYSYVVHVPDTYYPKSFDITHIFNGLDRNAEKILNEKRSTVVLAGAAEEGSGKANNNMTAENATGEAESSEGVAGEVNEEEVKQGLFRRIWDWLRNLFSGSEKEKFE